ncbi:MAG: ABC-F family ATP-binding cassette domain-containing protein [Candidatus Saccharibacteria bacterium]
MILSVDISEKSFGDKVLYHDLHLTVQPHEKVGLIGRNGTGKSTLLNLISGEDTDFEGDVHVKRGSIMVSSRQEHHGFDSKTVLEYIQGDLPEFARLSHIINTYPEHMGDSNHKMQQYADALERFGQLGYYQVEDEIRQMFVEYQLDESRLQAKLGDLSGGQKRLAELIKVQRSRADIALIDEPTNHMDYIAKEAFIGWLKGSQEAVVVITHDRDVLKTVDRIIEIRDGQAYPFRGNYDVYLRTNKSQIVSQVNEYDVTQRRIENLKSDIVRFRRMKEKARDPGTIHRFKGQQERAEKELAQLSNLEKPSFWIDRESTETMNDNLVAAYEKHKARTIRVRTKLAQTNSHRKLVEVSKLSLGYDDTILFDDVSFALHEGERIRLHGRNGAGKTTLVRAIMSRVNDQPLACTKFAGTVSTEKELNLGYYEQEIDAEFLPLTLHDAIEKVYADKDLAISEQRIKQLLSDYLFNPGSDGDVPLARLSGGQKARFQLIAMLANDPHILILDEPTNHLDLPSIEELEDALRAYHGAIIYISHDSYFAEKLGGDTITIGN